MHAYLNEQTNLVEVYHREPDEILTVQDFEERQHQHARQVKINELLAQLKDLGVNVMHPENAAPVSEPITAPTQEKEEAVPETAADTAPAETVTELPKVKKRW